MRKILTCLLLLVGVAWADPHANIGPKGEWITNGRWLMKVESVKTATDTKQLMALGWHKGIASPKGQEFVDQVDRLVFSKKGTFVVLDVSFKNPTSGSQKLGYTMPPWYIRCDDGQEVHNAGAIAGGAATYLNNHLPKMEPVAPGKTLRGKLTFVLPAERSPRLFFFKASPTIEKIAGKSETLVCRLEAAKASGASPLKHNRPEAAWQSNSLWKMRLVDVRYVESAKAYRALPWTDRLSGERRDKHFSYVERNVFNKGGRVLLVTVQAKNLSDGKVKIGYELPFWRVQTKAGKSLRLAGVYQQEMGWSLAGGMPKATLLNSNATAGGTFGFFLPKGAQPEALDFDAPGKLARTYGKPGSLLFKL